MNIISIHLALYLENHQAWRERKNIMTNDLRLLRIADYFSF